MLEWRGKLFEQRGELGKFLVAGSHGRCTWSVVAGQPSHHVYCVVGAALLTVVDDIKTAFDLFLDDVLDRIAHRCL